MQFLRDHLDQVGKLFEKGGKLEKFYALFEMQDTILFTPGQVTKSASHVRDGLDLKRMMITVVVALLPITLFAMYNTGFQVCRAIGLGATPYDSWHHWLWNGLLGLHYDSGDPLLCFALGALYVVPVFVVVGAVGGAVEGAFAVVRGHEITEGFLVTWFLLSLSLPPTIPLWQAAMGAAFGLIIGKEVFGGVGMNFLNPALTARAFLFFAYPANMSGELVWTAATAVPGVDAWSGATPLAVASAASDGAAALDANPDLWMQAFIGLIPGSMGETSTALCLLGALILIVTGVGSWQTMAGVTLGTFVSVTALNMIGSDTNGLFSVPFAWHVVLGGWAFGAVFMATDPVSSSFTDIGRWLYGIGIGFMVVLVRVINPAYPEGMMLAILFMNMFAPIIDHYVVQANIKRRNARYVGA